MKPANLEDNDNIMQMCGSKLKPGVQQGQKANLTKMYEEKHKVKQETG